MQYLALLYDTESEADNDPAELEAVFAKYFEFNRQAEAAGVLRGGNALMPSATATTVHVRDGEKVFTDGPFAETREALGGYYVLECENLDIALEWAARIPAAETGRVEVRPLMQVEGGLNS